jgi:VWFA-related protein
MKTVTLFLAVVFALAATVSAQTTRCLSGEEAKKVIESIKTLPKPAENKKLGKELLEMRAEREKLNTKISADTQKNQNLIPEAKQLGEKHLLRVCQMLKENGWLHEALVGSDAFEAFLFLISNNKDIQAQQELLPVLVEAAKRDFIGNPLLASFVDSIRVGARMPQIFGTQAAIRNNVVYLYPLQNEEKVDEWRKTYDLPPLDSQIRDFEARYVMPVLKSHAPPGAANVNEKENEKDTATQVLGLSDDENEAIQVETKLVSLNVRVLTPELKIPVGLKLTKDDFAVSENGVEQEIAFFSPVEQPFDLVLLLDFSGSALMKRDLIKESALRFVERARSSDRIAVVAFATEIKVVSDLTTDKKALTQKIKDINVGGGSPIWDSLRFVYDNIIKKESAGRRTAIVFMTDGFDDSPRTTFADAIETVRQNETTIFSVYLGRLRGTGDYGERLVRKSQQTLSMLAEESGGQFYKASDAKDLSGIYEQVINDLGQVYSIGYEPKNQARDGAWRALLVRIKNQPNLVAKTRRGYYAK